MKMNDILLGLKDKLIVSCQALEHEPLHGSAFMRQMAVAAIEGGAVGIRANGPADIKAIRERVDVPIIGLYKKTFEDSDIYITPTLQEVAEVVEAGADIIAFDATNRIRPGGQNLQEFVEQIKRLYPDRLLMADVSTLEEGIAAAEYGIDIISTTLAGYTPYSKQMDGFNFELLQALVEKIDRPIIAEGRIQSPEEAVQCLRLGAFSVVVGSAITRPQEITKAFSTRINLLSRCVN